MIELPRIIYMKVVGKINKYEMVYADACKAYGKACAAEAREQMREECIAAANNETLVDATETSGDRAYTGCR